MSPTATGAKRKRVVHVSCTESVSTQARRKGAADEVCERQPIYVHWFGLEMLKAYESAKSQIEKKYPIEIVLNSVTYSIEQDSLQNVTKAIKMASSLCTDTTSRSSGRGFMGCPELRNTEAAFTSLASRALDRFIFTDETTGACLHQAPCRKRKNKDKASEKPDVYIVPFSDFVPGDPGALSDWKFMEDLDHADRESSLYSGVGVEEGDCLDQYPVLIGIPATSDKMELQLHVNVVNMFWKLVVACGCPWDSAILCTLKAGILYLIRSNYLMTHNPYENPVLFMEMGQYSVLGPRKRVFLKENTTVYKFFDLLEDDFFHPSILHDLITKISILPDVKLTPPCTDTRLYTLSYTYIQGNEGNIRYTYQLKAFVGIVNMLSEMHKYGFVHGDVRLANMVFRKDGESHLIDFDFVGKHDDTVYANSFNHSIDGRHPNAIRKSRMMVEHDRFALRFIINTYVASSKKKQTSLQN